MQLYNNERNIYKLITTNESQNSLVQQELLPKSELTNDIILLNIFYPNPITLFLGPMTSSHPVQAAQLIGYIKYHLEPHVTRSVRQTSINSNITNNGKITQRESSTSLPDKQ